MPLNPFIRDKAYFQNIKDRDDRMKAVDFDAQFNQIADYINNQILPLLNQVIIDSIPGSAAPADVNKFLRNVGDGTTQWSSIGQSAIEDYSLEFTKFSKTNPGTILASGGDNILSEVTPQEAGQVLISVAGDKPIWRKIRSENIEDRQITAGKIAYRTLTNDNFQEGVLATQLIDNAVTAETIANTTIGTDKIADGAIDADILGDLTPAFIGKAPQGFDIPVQLYGNTIPDGFFTPVAGYFHTDDYYLEHFQAYINYTHIQPGTLIPTSKFVIGGISGAQLADGVIADYQIAPQSLDGARFWRKYVDGNGNYQYQLVKDINDLIPDSAITREKLTPRARQQLNLNY